MAVAEAAGLTDSVPTNTGLAGKAGQLVVGLEKYIRAHASGTRISIAGLGHGDPGLELRRSNIGARPGRAAEKATGEGHEGIVTGDPAFDSKFGVRGSMPLARALLDAGTREAVGTVFDGRLPLQDGREVAVTARVAEDEVVLEIPDDRSLSSKAGWLRLPEEDLPKVVGAALAFARRLVAPAGVAARIAENIRSEPEVRVRLRCLHTLIKWFPEDPASREALRAAAKVGSVEVRLTAAIALGEEGREALIALAQEEGPLAEPFRVRAIKALGGSIPGEVAERAYASAVANRESRAAAACLAALARIGGDRVVTALAKALAASDGELGAAAARALGDTSLPGAEAHLLANLEGRERMVTLAAVEALGRIGTARSVPQLKECAGRRPEDRVLERAVRQAVAEIQSRLEGAEPGQLSLAAANAGELTVVGEDTHGRLTVAQGDASGKLSVTEGHASGRLSVTEGDASGRLGVGESGAAAGLRVFPEIGAGRPADPEGEEREAPPRPRSRHLEGPTG